MKLSIIIPVYNTEQYISECIESIIDSNISDYEILLIDDGSTDNSGKICDDYAKQYDNILSFHKLNGGASSARNYGLKRAKGEYIFFLDSDDFLIKGNNLKNIVRNASADVIQFKMCYLYTKNKQYQYLRDINTEYANVKHFLYLQVENGTFSISPCDKIIKKSLLIINKIYFMEGIVAEDLDWTLQLFLKVKDIIVVNDNVYVYRQQRCGSVSTNINSKSIKSLVFIIDKWINYGYSDLEYKKIYMNYLAYQYVILITLINKRNCDSLLKKRILNMKDILKFDINFKVKLANKAINMLGIDIGRIILKTYLKFKNNGLFKI